MIVSTPLTVAVVAADLGLVGLLLGLIAVAARAERREGRTSPGPGYWLAATALAGWWALVFVLARGGAFESSPGTRLPVIVLGIVPPIVVGVRLIAVPAFWERLARIPLHWLVGVQFFRVVGGLFVIALLEDAMPAEFALPAGVGDVLVGLAAPVVAFRLAKHGPAGARSAAVAWCVLGLADLAIAVTCGFLTAPSAFQQLALDTPNAAITRYPFVLIPTFAVPVAIALHVYVLARLDVRSRWAAVRA